MHGLLQECAGSLGDKKMQSIKNFNLSRTGKYAVNFEV